MEATMTTSNDVQEATAVPIIRELPASPNENAIDDTLPFISSELEAEERGRLKRRRKSSHSPRRASSPSRGHDRTSGSRYRHHHHRKHHRPVSPSSSISPPTIAQKKHRRRSDAEPDHTFRGRVRNRSATLEEHAEEDEPRERENFREGIKGRKRSMPPSRNRDEEVDRDDMRRQRSYPNLYKEERRDFKGSREEDVDGVRTSGGLLAVQGV